MITSRMPSWVASGRYFTIPPIGIEFYVDVSRCSVDRRSFSTSLSVMIGKYVAAGER